MAIKDELYSRIVKDRQAILDIEVIVIARKSCCIGLITFMITVVLLLIFNYNLFSIYMI